MRSVLLDARSRASTPPAPLSELDVAAAYLGLESAELEAWLRHGGSLAEIARAMGRSPGSLFDVVVESRRARLDPHVSEFEQDRLLAEFRRELVSADRRSELLMFAAA